MISPQPCHQLTSRNTLYVVSRCPEKDVSPSRSHRRYQLNPDRARDRQDTYIEQGCQTKPTSEELRSSTQHWEDQVVQRGRLSSCAIFKYPEKILKHPHASSSALHLRNLIMVTVEIAPECGKEGTMIENKSNWGQGYPRI